MVYHLLACLYLCLKTESRVKGLSFETFENNCNQLPTYAALVRHLQPIYAELWWSSPERGDVYPLLEGEILKALKFKTNFISTAEIIFLIVCTFERIEGVEAHYLDKLLQEALFRSYLCLQGK